MAEPNITTPHPNDRIFSPAVFEPPVLTVPKKRKTARADSDSKAKGSSDFRGPSDRHRYLNRIASGLLPSRKHTPHNTEADSRENNDLECNTSQRSKNMTHSRTMGINLNFYQDEGYSDDKLVAVDIERSVYNAARTEAQLVSPVPLDVVVVVDNSIYSSPTTLIASCDLTIFLASILDPARDMLAVFCTYQTSSTSFQKPSDPLLRSANVTKIRTAVDAIEACLTKPGRNYLRDLLDKAQGLLDQASRPPNDRREASRHIFVFTANTSDVDGTALEHETQVHVVCPGCVPWRGRTNAPTHGWYLTAQYNHQAKVDNPHAKAPDDPLRSSFRALVSQARIGYHPDKFTNFKVSFKARAYCSIKYLIGTTELSELRPGEIRTVFVSVKIGNIGKGASVLTRFPRGLKTSSGNLDLEKELQMMLDDLGVPIVSSKARYTHSALPSGTVCELKRDVTLRSPISNDNADVHLSDARSVTLVRSQDQPRAKIQARLIYHLATTQTPNDALDTLRAQYGHDGSQSSCQEYFQSVVEELKYQARILERFDTVSETQVFKWLKENCQQSKGSSPSSFISRLTPHLARKSSSLSEIPRSSLASITNILPTIQSQSQEPLPQDSASKSKVEMKRHKQVRKGVENQKPGVKEEGSRETLRHIKALAVANKRIMGQDTLRELRWEERGQENVVPR